MCDDAGLLDGGGHGAGLLDRAGERLFADDVLAGLRRCDGDFGVDIVGRADIDHVDIRPRNDRAPVARRFLEAVAVAGGFRHRVRHVHHDLAVRNGRRRPEEHRHGSIGHGMRLAHEAATDHGDVHHFGHRLSPSNERAGPGPICSERPVGLPGRAAQTPPARR
jgi:hypothetical protein